MPPLVVRRAPYKDFLQPALQRRFAGTAAIVLGLAYFEALTLSSWDSFIWSWIPLGLPGLRALAIFLCALPIIVLRIAHSHMGIRTSNSPFETIVNTIFLFSTFETILTYAISAWLFSQIYLLSVPQEAGLRWISIVNGRARLNEHAVFYTVNVVVMGIIQGIIHVAMDQDRMLLGIVKAKRVGDATKTAASDHWATKIGERVPVLIIRTGMLAITVGILNYIFLYHFLRPSAWLCAIRLFRLTNSDLPKYNLPPSGRGPWSIWMLSRSIWASFLVCLLWYFSDTAFQVQLAREPLKNEQPLTSESKDPNGSLLNGLKSKKPRISAFAMWELAFIARDYEWRRLAIFEDIDREDGPMWSQIYSLSLETIKGLERRVDDFSKPPTPPLATEPLPATIQPRERISQPLKTDNVSMPQPTTTASFAKAFVAKLIMSSGKTPAQKLIPWLKKKALEVADRVMTKRQKEALRPDAVRALFRALLLRVLALPMIGHIFQRTFNLRLAKAVLGSPYAEVSVYSNAAYALSQLAVCSLSEDTYGNVQRDVPTIIRTFTVVIKKLEKFRDEFPTHWTDLSNNRQCPEMAELLTALKDGLNALVTAFGPYSSDLRLSRADMRLAREAAEKKEEAVVKPKEEERPGMQQVS
ncbi:nucleoporin protein Ndc1-Nup [Xylariaceae sp. FL1651]|nr:nucleoporin protein Ndc1-Nup [Xylariaceae sp. FL1651]